MDANDFEACQEVSDGVYVCKGKKPEEQSVEEVDIGIVGEVAKAVFITTSPILTKDEASWLENTFATVLIGSIISGLSIALGFYIYYLIGEFSLVILPEPLLNALLIMFVLVLLIAFLSFVQYRVSKALSSTNIMERFAIEEEKKEQDIEKTVKKFTFK